jgi:4'-phosphopantetheinyl transferase
MGHSPPPDGRQVVVRVYDLDATTSIDVTVLDRAERLRAGAFRDPVDGRRFAVRRFLLRTLLGTLADVEPENVSYVFGENGKPSLRDGGLHFSSSSSSGMFLVAVSDRFEIGCDIERASGRPGFETFGPCLSSVERRMLAESPEEERDAAFYGCWTRKEAYVKAIGAGFSMDPGSFSVPVDLGSDVVECQGGWGVRTWEPAPGFVASIAAPGTSWSLVTVSGEVGTEPG